MAGNNANCFAWEGMKGMGKGLKVGLRLRLLAAAVAACALACACVLGACAATGAGGSGGSGVLHVGVRADVVGFSSYNDHTGKYYGAEVDIAEELAKRLGYASVDYTAVTPDSREDALQSGQVDCLIACYSVSDTRSQSFDFSPEYYTDSIILVAQDSSLIGGIDDLQGCTFGTMSGANTASQLAQHLTEVGFSDGRELAVSTDGRDIGYDTWHLKTYASYRALSDALESGEVDVMACDGAIAKTYLNSERVILPGFSIDPQRYAVATQKGSALSAKVSDALQQMIDDGTVAGIIDTWD